MAALCAAILIGLQLSADYWAFLYLAWVMPLLALLGALAAPWRLRRRSSRPRSASGRLDAVGALAG